ncbi:MAG: MHYT domain-containing protein [Candidatus Sphingomonas phytovorans]|nr:MHYT domain-containing protein [Sphingomonas sp.]WEK00333.1 MAG: MHYT domain-containing protein [Sphingomonas sp.]
MLSVLACIHDRHDWRLIVVAALICVIGSFTSMLSFQRVQECERAHRYRWMAMAAVTCGTGIWATHFIAMLAYEGGFPISYAPMPTIMSIIVAITIAGGREPRGAWAGHCRVIRRRRCHPWTRSFRHALHRHGGDRSAGTAHL